MTECLPHELERWRADKHRFPPYQYRDAAGLLNSRGEWRRPSIVEREALMGFPVGYTAPCLPKGEQKGETYEDSRLTLLGNSWQVGVIAWLLCQLCGPRGLCKMLSVDDIIKALTPGAGVHLQTLLLRPPLARAGQIKCQSSGTLVKKLLGLVSIKGEDLLLQADSELHVKHHRLRASIPAKLWRWRTEMGKMKRHLEGRSKEERIEVRKNLGTLKSLTVQPQTRARYDKARADFYSFLHQNQLQVPRGALGLDSLLSEYVEHLWVTGEGRGKASDTIAAIQDLQPHVKGQLAMSWRLLKTWLVNEIPSRAPPMPEICLQAMIGWAIFKGEVNFGLSLMLGFYGLLRTGELLDVRASHVFLERTGTFGCNPQTGYEAATYHRDPCWGPVPNRRICQDEGMAHTVRVTVRAWHDPYIKAAELTHGSMDFGLSGFTELITGSVLLTMGCLIVLVPNILRSRCAMRRLKKLSRKAASPQARSFGRTGPGSD
eukprot:s123_g4.t1